MLVGVRVRVGVRGRERLLLVNLADLRQLGQLGYLLGLLGRLAEVPVVDPMISFAVGLPSPSW